MGNKPSHRRENAVILVLNGETCKGCSHTGAAINAQGKSTARALKLLAAHSIPAYPGDY